LTAIWREVDVLLFDSDELGRTEEFLSTHYAPMRISSTTPRSHARVSRTAGRLLTVDHLELGFVMGYDVTPLERINLCEVHSGSIEDHAPHGATPEHFGPGELFTLAPPERSYRGRINRARYSITMLDPSLLTDLAAPTPDRDPVRLLDHRPVSSAAAHRLRRAIAHVDRMVLADPDLEDDPLLGSAAARYLAAHVLRTFPHSAEPAAANASAAHPATVRRAVAYIEANADTDISPADIAAAAGVGVRALQLAFRRHLDTTPAAHLRTVRLAAAHRDLLTADPGATGATVAAVARRWGFGHLGRFSADYKTMYGEGPAQTLRG
jgi:AraC-like DNA-binding protein